MSTITTKDGTQIYYRDWGTGQPVVFSHGKGAPHGMCTTLKDRVNADLLAFVKGTPVSGMQDSERESVAAE